VGGERGRTAKRPACEGGKDDIAKDLMYQSVSSPAWTGLTSVIHRWETNANAQAPYTLPQPHVSGVQPGCVRRGIRTKR
jgi:hypothetical protein